MRCKINYILYYFANIVLSANRTMIYRYAYRTSSIYLQPVLS